MSHRYNSNIHRRRSIRLKGYDYARAGKYFLTICTDQRQCFFGDIVDGEMFLNNVGVVVRQCWVDIPEHFPQVELDDFVVMPNHVHGIISIMDGGVGNEYPVEGRGAKNIEMAKGAKNIEMAKGAKNIGMAKGAKNIGMAKGAKDFSPQQVSGTSKTVGSIVRGFKVGVTKWVRGNTDIYKVWQRNYWDHIIRDEQSLDRIRQYIRHNPSRWEDDKLFIGH